MTEIIQALQILSSKWQAIKSQGGTLNVDAVMEEISNLTDRFAGDLTAMGGLRPQKAPSMKIYVNVRLADEGRTREWRTVEAESLSDGIKIAQQMPDVELCLEASFSPGESSSTDATIEREVRIDLFTENGKLKARVASVDRENKKHEALLPDGTWVEVNLYSDHPESLFNISEARTQQIVKELTQ
jgi:hypothetical protein